ncbi:MAG: hypothetical protein H7839_20475 [Magnetococcus sp. YQC-5]
MQQQRKHDLSLPQQRLLELMREIQFGRIEGLAVHDGMPVFDHRPVVFREIKFGGEPEPSQLGASADFTLKAQVIEMLEHFRRMRNGVVEVLEIKNGLPFRMSIRESIGA